LAEKEGGPATGRRGKRAECGRAGPGAISGGGACRETGSECEIISTGSGTEVRRMTVTLTTEEIIAGCLAAALLRLAAEWRRRRAAAGKAREDLERMKAEFGEFLTVFGRCAGIGEIDSGLREYLFLVYNGYKSSLPRQILTAAEAEIFREAFAAVDSVFGQLISGRPDRVVLRQKTALLTGMAERIRAAAASEGAERSGL
jgi:hypothetical protein